jgi:hypothetical protein
MVIKASVDGDIVDGLDFVLKPKKTTSEADEAPIEVIKMAVKNTSRPDLQGVTKTNTTETNVVSSRNNLPDNKIIPVKTINTLDSPENKGAYKSATQNQINKYEKESFQNVTKVEGLFYSVQIGVFKKEVSPKQLLNLTPVYYEVLPNGLTRYVCGKYASKSEAEAAKKAIVAKGIKGAFVVAFKNGEKITVVNHSLDGMETDSLCDYHIEEDLDFVCTKVNE